jgi:hypothetical protein
MKYISLILVTLMISIYSSSNSIPQTDNTFVFGVCNDTINPFPSDTTILDGMTIICHYDLFHDEDPENGEYRLVSVYSCDTTLTN